MPPLLLFRQLLVLLHPTKVAVVLGSVLLCLLQIGYVVFLIEGNCSEFLTEEHVEWAGGFIEGFDLLEKGVSIGLGVEPHIAEGGIQGLPREVHEDRLS